MTSHRNFRFGKLAALTYVLLICATALTSRAHAQDRTPELFPGAQDQMCFPRQYDAQHLKKMPGQKVTQVLASIVKNQPPAGGLTLRVRFQIRAGEKPADVVGGCEWLEANPANPPSETLLLPTFRSKAGFACIAMFSRESAEEGGTIMFDIPGEGKSTVLHFDNRVGIWVETNPDKKRKHLRMGRDDRVFRLDRVADANCTSLISQVAVD